MKFKYRIIERFRGKYAVEAMYKVFGVSRSGYYAWRNRQGNESKDKWLVDLIAEIQTKSKQPYSCRQIRRWLKEKHKKNVNLNAILPIMRKYDLLSKVRRPYMRYQKTLYK